MDLDVVFIGTAGSAPTARRSLPATLVRRGGDRLLFDCGEGTQRQLLRSIGLMEPVIGKNSYELSLVELEAGEELRRDGYLIAPFAVEHRVPAFGYAIVED